MSAARQDQVLSLLGNSNKPYATRPLWSVVAFFRMMALDLTGQLHGQMSRLTPEHFAAEHP